MPQPPSISLLDAILRRTARRYRVPAMSRIPAEGASPATALAIAIEQARQSLATNATPPPAIKQAFLDALSRLIRDAMRESDGDPVFQAMLLRHRLPLVREYASLAARAAQDRREIIAAANAIAHPAKVERMPAGPARDAMAALQAAAASESWAALPAAAHRLLSLPADAQPAALALDRLLASPALEHLQRLDVLACDSEVRRYRALWERQGPRPGSATALAEGNASRLRGDAVEAQALHALQALASRLNDADGGKAYQAVSSMRVPSSMPANAERAKTEWDAALLRRAHSDGAPPAWDPCLLLEAKASADAAATDFPRLLRGLRLLAQADPRTDYAFSTRQGLFPLRGAALCTLPAEGPQLDSTVLYCCDGPADAIPRLLSAASRMQLLSAPSSLEYAGRLAQGPDAAPETLEPVWQQLLQSEQWSGVLQQYPTLCQARELMAHPDDLMAAIESAAA
ncbi:3-deoxy-D-arabino-heptulosonate 7-phosphate synthase [Achromobacter pestifer]|uniref:3-deoxy-D-arabino-heptulosonate 7-phosphate synthase n=1 Tax=Achromobacter pestifer TaxID=1353889 RepID=A0A7D4E2E9_9BURK|nr:3-deoxy-D-arabino-heptulosonate 7-phosphate synthase [Achromobacter pestifer]QKH39047.1 3-deoxy-D-arabino-heptulosonate 7-phosphate synthase [Achromobacter pestifer]